MSWDKNTVLMAQWRKRVGHLDYAFQPIVNIHTGRSYGCEALLRGVEAAGFDQIGRLFDQANEDGMLHQVDLMLREIAAAKFSRLPWHRSNRLFFNLDNRLFDSVDYREGQTAELLRRFGLHKDTICFEISEKNELQNVQETVGTLNAYRNQGFKIAVDDCGTGFSGLQLLYYTEPDFIKIDRFFIQDIAADPKKRLFVSSIVNIAHLMGSTVVAEGVETKQEYFSCRDIGCDLIQGYLVQAPEVDLSRLQDQYDHIRLLAKGDHRKFQDTDRKLILSEMVPVKTISENSDMVSVFERFREHSDTNFFPVVNGTGEPVGVIREAVLKDYAYSRYGRELLLNPAFGKDIRRFISKFPIADVHTPIEKILEIYSQNDTLEGLLMVEGMKYAGFLSARSLLKVINEKNLAIARDQNPLTKLPGNTLIYEYVSRALQDTGTAYVLVYFDFDHFKAYNDTYGFRHGDRLILLFAELLKSVSQSKDRFAAHIGGDDFFMGIEGAELPDVQALVAEIVSRFGRDAESFYDTEAIQRGYILAKDRDGSRRRFPLLTVSTVVLALPAGAERIYSAEEISGFIATLKSRAKCDPNRICLARIGHFNGGGPEGAVVLIGAGVPKTVCILSEESDVSRKIN